MTTQATNFFIRFERVLSKTRFNSYKNGGSEQDALCRHIWNTSLCESLYPSFQILEVGFRNAAHLEIGLAINDANWLSNETQILYADELSAIQSAKADLFKRTKVISEDFLVAELRFGFWTSLLDSRYDRLWHKMIATVFPHMPKTMRTRGDASKLMNTVRRLRNAALHHHSIWHWKDLQEQHAQMQTLIGYVCDSLAITAKETDRFPQIYCNGYKQFEAIGEKLSNQDTTRCSLNGGCSK